MIIYCYYYYNYCCYYHQKNFVKAKKENPSIYLTVFHQGEKRCHFDNNMTPSWAEQLRKLHVDVLINCVHAGHWNSIICPGKQRAFHSATCHESFVGENSTLKTKSKYKLQQGLRLGGRKLFRLYSGVMNVQPQRVGINLISVLI